MINNFFSVYNMKGHLYPFDTGFVEKNMLYFSGYVNYLWGKFFIWRRNNDKICRS